MAKSHRTNVLVTSCLKTPVDPHTKAPLASYERSGLLPLDNRHYEEVKALNTHSRGVVIRPSRTYNCTVNVVNTGQFISCF